MLRTVPGVLSSLLVLLLVPSMANAQLAYFSPDTPQEEFDPAIPTPEQFLGYPIGTHYTRNDRIVDYFNVLARLSDRVSVEVLGETYEHRPQIGVVITSTGNRARLAQIQAERARVLEAGAPAQDAASQPVIVGLLYGVHGWLRVV